MVVKDDNKACVGEVTQSSICKHYYCHNLSVSHDNTESLITTLMISPPMEAVMRKVRRALDPVRAMEGVPSMSEAYRQNRIRLGIRSQQYIALYFFCILL